jgi:superfamily I DNA/RNA helicase
LSLHLEHLNPEQLAAVTASDRHALILAGAGSGKTRVLTTRIAWLVSEGRASPGSILAVTFTNKAAREMLARVAAMLPINPRGMWIGTFHGLANRMLRLHYRDAGLPQTFQILDSQDQLAAVKRMLKRLQADEDRFPPREVQLKRASAHATYTSRMNARAALPTISPPTTSNARPKAWSTSRSCCCAPTSCSRETSCCASTTASASSTS